MSFSVQITRWGVKTADKIQQTRRAVTIKLFNAVILDTPVLTGRARANWRIQEQAPQLEPLNAEDPSGGVSLRAVQEVASKTIGDNAVFLANNLPYIKKLEEGYSRKAPEGMVRRNVLRFARLIKIEVSQ